MKKAVSFLAAGAMSASLSFPAFAAALVPCHTSGGAAFKYQVDTACFTEDSA